MTDQRDICTNDNDLCKGCTFCASCENDSSQTPIFNFAPSTRTTHDTYFGIIQSQPSWQNSHDDMRAAGLVA
jgi:hypothetical protein